MAVVCALSAETRARTTRGCHDALPASNKAGVSGIEGLLPLVRYLATGD